MFGLACPESHDHFLELVMEPASPTSPGKRVGKGWSPLPGKPGCSYQRQRSGCWENKGDAGAESRGQQVECQVRYRHFLLSSSFSVGIHDITELSSSLT